MRRSTERPARLARYDIDDRRNPSRRRMLLPVNGARDAGGEGRHDINDLDDKSSWRKCVSETRPLNDAARCALEAQLLNHFAPWLRGGAA